MICDDRSYVWWVGLDDDTPYHVLHVVSEDKRLVLSCPLDHPRAPYIVTQGTTFQGCDRRPAVNRRYLLPMPLPEVVTPQFVAMLIRWATTGNGAVRIAWERTKVPV